VQSERLSQRKIVTTPDLPACCAVPQPTAPLHTLIFSFTQAISKRFSQLHRQFPRDFLSYTGNFQEIFSVTQAISKRFSQLHRQFSRDFLSYTGNFQEIFSVTQAISKRFSQLHRQFPRDFLHEAMSTFSHILST